MRPRTASTVSIADLLRELRADLTLLAKQEIALIREEIRLKGTAIGKDISIIAGGLFAVAIGVVTLLVSCSLFLSWLLQVSGLSGEIADPLGFGIVAITVATAGTILTILGIARIKDRSLTPELLVDREE